MRASRVLVRCPAIPWVRDAWDDAITVPASHMVWAFEAADRLTRVHTPHGVFDVDLSLSAIEASFGRALARVHRNWLVNVQHIKELERDTETRIWVGDGLVSDARGIHVPVARERAQQLRDTLLADATGLRRTT